MRAPDAECLDGQAPQHMVAPVNFQLGGDVLGGDLALAVRLQWLFHGVGHKFGQSVCILQAWLPKVPAPGSNDQDYMLHSEPRVAVITDARFASFRLQSCHSPVQFKNSMTGRVWRTGAVQMVQNLRLVPPSMHPRLYLSDADLDCLGEALYIPVYDQYRPGAGPITVLEALLPAHSQDPICSADLLSFISAGLATLKLSVSNPVVQPIRRSALSGRRARAPADSAPDMQQDGLAGGSTQQPAANVGDTAAAPEVIGVAPQTIAAVAKTISGPTPVSQPASRNTGAATNILAAAALCHDAVVEGEEGAGSHGQLPALPGTVFARRPAPSGESQQGSATTGAAGDSHHATTRSTQQQGSRPSLLGNLGHRHSNPSDTRTPASGPGTSRSGHDGEACSPAMGAPPLPSGAVDGPEGGSDGGSHAEVWDRMPRKVRRVGTAGGVGGGGLIRSQSSFHMAGVPGPLPTASPWAPAGQATQASPHT